MPTPPPSAARTRASAVLTHQLPPQGATLSDYAAFAGELRTAIATTRAGAQTTEEHGVYERCLQPATVIAESVERIVVALLQIQRAMGDLPTALDGLD